MRGFVVLIVLLMLAVISAVAVGQLSVVSGEATVSIRREEEAQARAIAEGCLLMLQRHAEHYMGATGALAPPSPPTPPGGDFDLLLNPDGNGPGNRNGDEHVPAAAGSLAAGRRVEIPGNTSPPATSEHQYLMLPRAGGACFIRFEDNSDDDLLAAATMADGTPTNCRGPGGIAEGTGTDINYCDRDGAIYLTAVGVYPKLGTDGEVYSRAHARVTLRKLYQVAQPGSFPAAVMAGGDVDIKNNITVCGVGGIQAGDVNGKLKGSSCMCGSVETTAPIGTSLPLGSTCCASCSPGSQRSGVAAPRPIDIDGDGVPAGPLANFAIENMPTSPLQPDEATPAGGNYLSNNSFGNPILLTNPIGSSAACEFYLRPDGTVYYWDATELNSNAWPAAALPPITVASPPALTSNCSTFATDPIPQPCAISAAAGGGSCVGGLEPGQACLNDTQCPGGGTCTGGAVCIGGATNGAACTGAPADCGGVPGRCSSLVSGGAGGSCAGTTTESGQGCFTVGMCGGGAPTCDTSAPVCLGGSQNGSSCTGVATDCNSVPSRCTATFTGGTGALNCAASGLGGLCWKPLAKLGDGVTAPDAVFPSEFTDGTGNALQILATAPPHIADTSKRLADAVAGNRMCGNLAAASPSGFITRAGANYTMSNATTTLHTPPAYYVVDGDFTAQGGRGAGLPYLNVGILAGGSVTINSGWNLACPTCAVPTSTLLTSGGAGSCRIPVANVPFAQLSQSALGAANRPVPGYVVKTSGALNWNAYTLVGLTWMDGVFASPIVGGDPCFVGRVVVDNDFVGNNNATINIAGEWLLTGVLDGTANNITITGDVYTESDAAFKNNWVMNGRIFANGDIEIANNAVITFDGGGVTGSFGTGALSSFMESQW